MKAKKETFPLKVKRGSVTVKIYNRKKNFPYYRVAYHLGGERKQSTFADLDAARREAEAKASHLSRGDVDAALLTGKDRLVYGRALEAVRPLGVPLDTAALDYAAARKILGDVNLADAARFYARHHGGKIVSKPVADVVKEFLADRADKGLSETYIGDLRFRLNQFAKAFHCPLNAVGAEDIRAFLQSRKLSPRSHNNFVGGIRTLFAFAKSRNFVPKDTEALEGVDKVKARGGAIEIFTPREMEALLAAASPDLAPVFAIGAFAGLRTEEILRLDWSEVSLADGRRDIEIKAAKSKTASRRLVPVSGNLAAWLAPYAGRTGKIWPHGKAYLFECIRRTADAARVPWKQNAMRHSYISYRLAEIQNVNQVALEAGNSPSMIFQHYRELVRPAQAAAWFAVAPARAENVVAMHGATARL